MFHVVRATQCDRGYVLCPDNRCVMGSCNAMSGDASFYDAPPISLIDAMPDVVRPPSGDAGTDTSLTPPGQQDATLDATEGEKDGGLMPIVDASPTTDATPPRPDATPPRPDASPPRPRPDASTTPPPTGSCGGLAACSFSAGMCFCPAWDGCIAPSDAPYCPGGSTTTNPTPTGSCAGLAACSFSAGMCFCPAWDGCISPSDAPACPGGSTTTTTTSGSCGWLSACPFASGQCFCPAWDGCIAPSDAAYCPG